MKRFKITDHIEYIIPDDEITRFLCSGMIIRDRANVFFDTNLGEVETRTLLKTEKPDFALISHYHLDHSLWGGYVLEWPSAELFVPSREEHYLKDLEYFLARTGGKGCNSERWRQFVTKKFRFDGFKGFRTYDGSSKLDTGVVKMAFVSAPGHSPGHTAVHFPEEGILFTSDLGLGPFGPWYGFEDGDITHYIESIMALKSMKPKLLLTGHNGMIREDIDAVFDRCIDAFFVREAAIRKKMERGLSEEKIEEEGIYFPHKTRAQGPLKHFLSAWDAVMFDHHREIIMNGGLEKDFPGITRT